MNKPNVWVVTGGTGSIGRAIVEHLIPLDEVDAIRVVSRSESKQAQMRDELDCPKIRYILGDVRDKEKMKRAFIGAHTVIHAAAIKRVEVAQYNPDVATEINVHGSVAVAGAAIDREVERVLLISTDKAVNPQSIMGMSKAVAEKCFQAYNSWSSQTKFWVVRLGNVLHSTGSVLPTWERQAKKGPIQVTDPTMTRLIMTKGEVSQFVMQTFDKEPGLYVPKGCRKILLRDLAEVFCEIQKCEWRMVGKREGEKHAEELLSLEEAIKLEWVGADYKSDCGKVMAQDEIREMLIECAEE